MSERREFTGGDGHACGRGGELLAYLYGEATPEEDRLFAGHMKACAACREEVAAFRSVREGLGAWREEVLGAAPAIEVAHALAPSPSHAASDVRARPRTALDALREFLLLTPLWLRAGGAFAALAVCALAAMAVMRAEVRWDERGFAFDAGRRERVVERQVEVQAPGTYTERQLEEVASERVRAALAEQAEELRRQSPPAVVTAAGAPPPKEVVNVPVRAERQPRRNNRSAPANNSRTRQDELLAEDTLPGLYDLLRDAN